MQIMPKMSLKPADILVLAGKPITHGKKPISAMENKG
jgi:hypothetical protein